MPREHQTLTALFSDIADKIRAKKGTTEAIVADDFPSEIESIPSGGGVSVEPLNVTANGTYAAPSGKAYTPVTVNVPTPSPHLQAKSVSYTSNGQRAVTADAGYDGLSSVSINVGLSWPPSSVVAGDTPVITNASVYRSTSTSYTNSNISITVPKSGTYRFRWVHIGNYGTMSVITTDYSVYTRLYVNGVAQGNEHTYKGNELDIPHQDLTLSAGDTVTLWVKSQNTTYPGKCGFLIACVKGNNDFMSS